MGNYQLILKMVNLPSSSIRQWGSFKVGLLKPFKTKMSCLKRVPRVSESEEGITASSAVCSDNWQMGKSDRIFLEMLIFLLSHRLSDFRLHARAEVEKKKKKGKETHIAMWVLLSKATSSRQEKPGKKTYIRFQASWVYPLKPSPAINVPHSGFALHTTVVTHKNLLLPAWSDLQMRKPSYVSLPRVCTVPVPAFPSHSRNS